MAASYADVLKSQSGVILPLRDKIKTREIRRPHCLHMQFSREKPFEDGFRNAAKNIILQCLTKNHVKTIAVRPYNSIDVTCISRAAVLKLSTFLESHPIPECKWYLYEPEKVRVDISWVPGHLTTSMIKTALLKHVQFDSEVSESKDKDGIGQGTMNVQIQPKLLNENPIPSYIYVDGYMLTVKYYGQRKTCKQCGSFEHFKIDCPLRIQNQENRQRMQKQSKITALKDIVNIDKLPPKSQHQQNRTEQVINLSNVSSSTQEENKQKASLQITPKTSNHTLPNSKSIIETPKTSQSTKMQENQSLLVGQQKRLHSDSPNEQPRFQRKFDNVSSDGHEK
uniref:uncharacterized protein LOC120347253 n=1 Tax=Styela clava TaxID=7725 RepID=UPI00193972E4|nr:uncharacterized protein LOC120347253 [Styela clava]